MWRIHNRNQRNFENHRPSVWNENKKQASSENEAECQTNFSFEKTAQTINSNSKPNVMSFLLMDKSNECRAGIVIIAVACRQPFTTIVPPLYIGRVAIKPTDQQPNSCSRHHPRHSRNVLCFICVSMLFSIRRLFRIDWLNSH